jgi:SAM-dependent methyltransferase
MTHDDLRRLQRDWDDLAAGDPLWAILSDPARRYGRWDLTDFLESGEREVAALMRKSESLGHPTARGRALDFGCGVGRLTRALGVRFRETVGVDISPTMIDQARRVNADRPNCTFVHNVQPALSIFPDASFDLVYTNIVLQHLPNQSTAERYIGELVRVLAAGGLLVFQIPDVIPLRHRIQPRRRLYHALQSVGVRSTRVHRALGLHPIRMIGLPEARAVAVVTSAGGTVLDVHVKRLGTTSIWDRMYFVTRYPQSRPGRGSESTSR